MNLEIESQWRNNIWYSSCVIQYFLICPVGRGLALIKFFYQVCFNNNFFPYLNVRNEKLGILLGD